MTKHIITLLLFLTTSILFAQKDCELSSNFTDSIGSYKSTKDYLIHEKVFGGKKSNIYFSLVNTDGLITLSFQSISSSQEFMKANCFDKRSKIFFQLANGKIVTLLAIDNESCGTPIRKDNENFRILTGNFLFVKENYEELKKSPINLMRVIYNSETVDYIIKEEFVSETDNKTYKPESYFIEYLKCIE
jgi:hypothetical protein